VVVENLTLCQAPSLVPQTVKTIIRPKKSSFFGLVLETVFTDEFVKVATRSSSGSKMPRADWNILQHYEIPVPNND
jgi:type I restriction enzyme S subunit